jgi:hypothetical protein
MRVSHATAVHGQVPIPISAHRRHTPSCGVHATCDSMRMRAACVHSKHELVLEDLDDATMEAKIRNLERKLLDVTTTAKDAQRALQARTDCVEPRSARPAIFEHC